MQKPIQAAVLLLSILVALTGSGWALDAVVAPEQKEKILESLRQQYRETIKARLPAILPNTPPPEGFKDWNDYFFLRSSDQYIFNVVLGKNLRQIVASFPYGSLANLKDDEQYYCVNISQSSAPTVVVMSVKTLQVVCIYHQTCG